MLTKGRIVLYKNIEGEEFPAIVRKVNDAGNADLSVFGPDGVFTADDIAEGEEVNTWAWPPHTDTVREVEV